MKSLLFSSVLLLAAANALAADAKPEFKDDVSRLPADVAERYRAILPQRGEMKWLRTPWLVDLGEGIRVAKTEKRPLLIWVSGDEPLERC